MSLPVRVGAWQRGESARRIVPADIFAYMDGAGELYLGYRFDHLDVWQYASASAGEILVELYWMKGSDDAWGLLSGDWGGEPVALGGASPGAGVSALYGAGLLRLASDDLYARVLASQDTAEARAAVLEIGRAIVAGRATPPAPALVRALPDAAGRLERRADRTCFLRSHLVLNSIYFISNANILKLEHTCEAVATTYAAPGTGGPRARLLVIRYPDSEAAARATASFVRAYLPEMADPIPEQGCRHVEDGWTAFARSGRALALAFECADEDLARSVAGAGVQALKSAEVGDAR